MSQYYALPRFSLARAQLGVKVLVSLFTLATLAALALGLYVFCEDTDFTRAGVIEHYLGNEDNPGATTLKFPVPERKLLETLHIHAFTTVILLFVLFHFLGLVRMLGERMKAVIFMVGFLSMAGMLASPWMVRFHDPAWAGPMLWCGAVFSGTCALSAILTLAEIWLPAGAAPGGHHPPHHHHHGEPRDREVPEE